MSCQVTQVFQMQVLVIQFTINMAILPTAAFEILV